MNNFKPVKQDKVVISIRIDADLLKMVDKSSIKYDLSRNEFIVQCIDYALKNLEKTD